MLTLSFTLEITTCSTSFSAQDATVTLTQYTGSDSIAVSHQVSSKNANSQCSWTVFTYKNSNDNSAPSTVIFDITEAAGSVTVSVKGNIDRSNEGTYQIYIRETESGNNAVYVDSVIVVNLVELVDCYSSYPSIDYTLASDWKYIVDHANGNSAVKIEFTGANNRNCAFTTSLVYACDTCGLTESNEIATLLDATYTNNV